MVLKSKILLMTLGGTVCQKKDKKGIYQISKESYFPLIPEIFDLANIDIIDLGSIDSTDMSLQDRKNITDTIRKNHRQYDGFVIVQGTDTMAESAIAMNYMIQNMGKPIVFTGSQKSIYEENSDAPKNIQDSVRVASKNLGESVIVFGGNIIRGSRAIKEHSEELDAFFSPKIPLLGKVTDEKVSLKECIPRSINIRPNYFTHFKKNVFYYKQISGADTNILEKVVQDIDISGIVIGGYGTGNINSKYLKALEQAYQKGKPVAITTACRMGSVDKIYSTGSEALKRGAFLTGDLTAEAATQKMMYSLGRIKSNGHKREERINLIRRIMQTPIGRDMNPL